VSPGPDEPAEHAHGKCPSCNVQAKGGTEKHSPTALKLMGRHGPSFELFLAERDLGNRSVNGMPLMRLKNWNDF
jgi:hypothetical protein